MNKKLWQILSVLMVGAMALTACAAPATPTAAPTSPPVAPPTAAPVASPTAPAMAAIDCAGAQSGDELHVMYQWSGAEEENINTIFKPLVDACGIKIVAESTRDAAVLDTKAKSTPPDVLFWPTTAPMNLYTDKLKDLTSLGAQGDNYASFWKDLGTVNGQWLAVPVKADVKSIIWYSPAQFQTFGYQVPTTFDELNTLVEKMVADGNVPWSMGFESGAATGWTGSDFIQDLLLTQQGPQYVMDLISGKTAYDDAGVQQAYATYYKWASDAKYTVGGAQGTVSTAFLDAIYKVFSDPPEAMMVKQSGFAGGEIVKQFPSLKYGTDYDFFGFPGAKGLQGGADFMMAFNDTPAVKAMVGYLTGAAGAEVWAQTNTSVTPNKLAVGQYTDPQLAKFADMLANTQGFTPDLGDTIPAPFGDAEWKAIVNVVQGGSIPTELKAVATAQSQALSK